MQLGDSPKGQTCPLFGDRENMGKFPGRRKYTNRIGKLKEFVESRSEFGGTGFKYYSWDIIRAFGFRGVELEKGFSKLASGELNRWHCECGCRVERRLEFFIIQIGIGSKDRCKKVGLR